ncbi:MAG: hypothetical protein C4329_06740 [Chitinophagaceae bacterium]
MDLKEQIFATLLVRWLSFRLKIFISTFKHQHQADKASNIPTDANAFLLGATLLMTRHFIGILFSSFLFLTQSIGQIHSKKCLESFRGCLVTPLDNYEEIHDINFRRSEHTFDNADSSLSFVTDNASNVKAACD